VRPLHARQQLGRVGPAGERVAQIGAEPVDDGAAPQEQPQVVRELGEDLGVQVLADEPVVAAEPSSDLDGVLGVGPQGQRREMQSGEPPLGAGVQQVDLGGCTFRAGLATQ
jgi:hypothetical protein